jgi:hypothetical protein
MVMRKEYWMPNAPSNDKRCDVCREPWQKNHMTNGRGKKVWVGYYHLCETGDIVRVDVDMKVRGWDAPME